MLMGWSGYSLGLFGWCLWRDYDVTLGQLMSPFHPYSGGWPPAKIPAGQIWPGKQAASSAPTTASTGGGGGIVGTVKSNISKELKEIGLP